MAQILASPVIPSPTPIVGIKTPGGEPSMRLPLDVFERTQPLAFSLYVQGLAAWQKAGNETVDQDNKNGTGYFQVNGIHGVPPVKWQEDPTDPANKSPTVGYCTHRSVLFIPWHRPYLMLFEQIIYTYAEDIVNKATGNVKAEYAKALSQVRLPYWDWASNPALPKAVMSKDITVTVPSETPGTTQQLHLEHNPLYSYKFTSEYAFKVIWDIMGWDHNNEWKESKRCPNAKGESEQKIADIQMRTFKYFKDLTFQHLVKCQDFDEFTSQAWRDGQGIEAYTSVEAMHNNIHNYVGTNDMYIDDDNTKMLGSMTEVQASSFDPIFWLHHVNCDRLTALWQALNTNVVINEFPSLLDRYNANANTMEGGSSRLEPWHKTTEHTMSDYYIADDVKELISTFEAGYYYPETPVTYIQDPAEMKKYTTKQIYSLYAPTGARKPKPPPMLGSPMDGTPDGEPLVGGPAEGVPDTEPDNTTETWQVFLRVRNFALIGTWAVHIFLGEVPTNATDYFLSENRVGSVSMLSTIAPDSCDNCLSQAAGDQLVTGSVPLTDELQNRGVDVGDEAAVTAYLTANLSWRVAKDTQDVPITDDMKLTVGVSSQTLTLPDNFEELPTYGESHVFPDVTSGKPGGLSQENRDELQIQAAVQWH